MSEKNKDKSKSNRRFRLWVLFILFFVLAVFAVIVTYGPQIKSIFNSLISGQSPKSILVQPIKAKSPELERRFAGLERRFAGIEEKLSALEIQVSSQEKAAKGNTVELVKEILANVRKMPEIQDKFSALRVAIETGRPFDKEYEGIKPYIEVTDDQKEKIKLFIKTSNLGVKPYEQLKRSFQDVEAKILFQLPENASWKDRTINFFKSLFSIRPKARIIDDPQTPADYVISIEAMLELRDLDGVARLLEQSENIKQADYKHWRHAFRAYCFAIDTHKMLAEQAYALNFKGL